MHRCIFGHCHTDGYRDVLAQDLEARLLHVDVLR